MTYQPSALTALGDPTRRAIFELLADRLAAVGELARNFPVSRPAVCQHLKVLEDAGLVVDWPDGNRRIYHIDPGRRRGAQGVPRPVWSRSLASFKQAVEDQQGRSE